ncbi:MAG TPA: hypothetical protein VH951_07660 [Dehalococcoidia bacterium]
MTANSAPKKGRRHSPRSFYEEALSEAERADLPRAHAVEGIDEEIAALRLRLKTALLDRPSNFDLMLKGVGLLVRAVVAKYGLGGGDRDALEASMLNLATEFRSLLGQPATDTAAPEKPHDNSD